MGSILFKKKIPIGYYIVDNTFASYIFDEKNKILYIIEADYIFESENCSEEDIKNFWNKKEPKWSKEVLEKELKRYNKICREVINDLSMEELNKIAEKANLKKLTRYESRSVIIKYILENGIYKLPSDINIIKQVKIPSKYIRNKKVTVKARKIILDVLNEYNGCYHYDKDDIETIIKRIDDDKVYLFSESWITGIGLERSGTLRIDEIPEEITIEFKGLFEDSFLQEVLYDIIFALYHNYQLLEFHDLGS